MARRRAMSARWQDEAELRDRLANQARAKRARHGSERDQPPAPRRSRAAKRLAECPGVGQTSASGKIMRPLPSIWRAQQQPLKREAVEDVKPKAEMKLEEEVGADQLSYQSALAGLEGLNSTFSFPTYDKKGKLRNILEDSRKSQLFQSELLRCIS